MVPRILCGGDPSGLDATWREWHVAAPSALTMLLFYGCLVLLWQRVGCAALRMAAGAGVLLLLLWWTWSPRMFLDGDRFRVTFLDVGQGDSAVVELPDGQVVLIDGGRRTSGSTWAVG